MQNTAPDINRRFFQALQQIIDSGEVANFNSFCETNDIDRPNLIRLRRRPTTHFPVDLLVILVDKYKVSPHWLLTGKYPPK